MAKGQHLSSYQKKIVNRYYEHLDTIAITKIAEATSELYLCEDPKKAERLWKSVENALEKTAAGDKEVRAVLTRRDIAGLAKLVNKLSGK